MKTSEEILKKHYEKNFNTDRDYFPSQWVIDAMEEYAQEVKNFNISTVIKSLRNKCEGCGCYDGIHKADCYLINKWS